jgi:hypothetical protein
MHFALLEAVYGHPGQEMRTGERLFDLTIDLGGAFLQNCPPISHYRLVLRERAAFRRALAKPGDEIEPGACLAVFTTEPDESGEGVIARPLRIATAAILSHPGMWSAPRPS